MLKIELGINGLSVSNISLGCMQIASWLVVVTAQVISMACENYEIYQVMGNWLL